MDQQKFFEVLGRKQLVIEEQDAAATEFIKLLAGLVSGEIDRSRVMVNLTDRTWVLAEVGQRPATPPTINGLPVCVVSPE